jgi:hypothetical protein
LYSYENSFTTLNLFEMIGVIGKEKKVKDPIVESQKIVDNHNKAAMHHEAAAMHHHEAAKHQMAGNSTMACGCNVKAKDQTNLAKKAQKKNAKKQKAIT